MMYILHSFMCYWCYDFHFFQKCSLSCFNSSYSSLSIACSISSHCSCTGSCYSCSVIASLFTSIFAFNIYSWFASGSAMPFTFLTFPTVINFIERFVFVEPDNFILLGIVVTSTCHGMACLTALSFFL